MSSSREIGALFEEVDCNHNGFITRKELTDYVEKNHLPPETVDLAKMFEAIDTNFNGYITRDELEDYAKKTGQPESMVDDWFKWFDFGNTGKITYEDMCETLAIGMTKSYSEKVEKKREMIQKGKIAPPKDMPKEYAAPQPKPGWLEGVTLLYTGRSEEGLLEYVVSVVKSANMQDFDKESSFARYLKETMEKKWGRHWQVIVSQSTFGCAVGHEENYFVHFQYGPHLFILYRTTE
ncbi:Tegument antigen [Echinococcus granulosus]|uniref:Tegumental antigen n=1 Tax=Echinococcus granulosus TaxID=6210 RepID=A0A068WYV6_ECHGR|nr:Tegument antigen [Echinococcus granulosus]CDS22827.1 tegumental antigen [Echinococcus granulosus]